MDPQVLIVGAGPTGLVLALWLQRLGVPFRIIEKHAGPAEASRAMAVQARTLEFYQQLGFASQVVEAGIPVHAIHLRENARQRATLDFSGFGRGITPFPFVLTYPQDEHEHFLVNELAAAGIAVEWNTELTSFTDDGPRVHGQLLCPGGPQTCEAQYLCGCDGARSTVRETLQLNFPGGTYQERFYVADVHAEGDTANIGVNLCLGTRSFTVVFPIRSTGMHRLIGIVPQRITDQEQITFEDLRADAQQLTGLRVSQVNWFATYHVHHRVADHFHVGRAFLCGDAGHIHSPAGGQGMNTGIGDAVNLSWKLADVLQGRANPTLLDTYEQERLAFARTLVKTTDRAFTVMVGATFWQRCVRSLVVPYLLPLLLKLPSARRTQFRLVSQTRIAYPDSRLSSGRAGKIRGGDRLPWISDADNFAPLASLRWQIHVYGAADDSLRNFSRRMMIPLHELRWTPAARRAGFKENALYLIRPDGHVAFASPAQDAVALAAALAPLGLFAAPSNPPNTSAAISNDRSRAP